jgi:hypothetical protein
MINYHKICPAELLHLPDEKIFLFFAETDFLIKFAEVGERLLEFEFDYKE